MKSVSLFFYIVFMVVLVIDVVTGSKLKHIIVDATLAIIFLIWYGIKLIEEKL